MSGHEDEAAEVGRAVAERTFGYGIAALRFLAESDYLLIMKRGEQFPNGEHFTTFGFAAHGDVPVLSPALTAAMLRAAADQIEDQLTAPGTADR